METKEIQELRRWSAEDLMGWQTITDSCGTFYTDGNYLQAKKWTPDLPQSGQIWLVVDKMRELGWRFVLNDGVGLFDYHCYFFKAQSKEPGGKVDFGPEYIAYNINPCKAILEAAKAALETQNGS